MLRLCAGWNVPKSVQLRFASTNKLRNSCKLPEMAVALPGTEKEYPSRTTSYPPGPPRLPIIGNLHQVAGKQLHVAFAEWAKIYGDIFSVKFGSYDIVVLNSAQSIKCAFTRTEFSGRPNFPGGRRGGIGFQEGVHWKEQRKFVVKKVHSLCTGKGKIENLAHEEVWKMELCLKQTNETPIDPYNLLMMTSLNIFWGIIAEKTYSHGDPFISSILEALTASTAESKTAIFRFFPHLYALWKRVAFISNNPKKQQNQLQKFFDEIIQDCVKKVENGQDPSNVIEFYLNHIKSCSDSNSSFYKAEGLRNLKLCLRDLWVAGHESTASALAFQLLLMAKHPSIQKKMYEEIQQVTGSSRSPNLGDRKSMFFSMPFVRAVLKELLRFTGLTPLGLYHQALKDCSLHGFTIPKGTLVLSNLYAAGRDPQTWVDPDRYWPERFLSHDGQLLRTDSYIPFGTGERICLGMHLAQDEIFLVITKLLQKFEVLPDHNGKNIDLEGIGSKLLIPKPQKLIFRMRSF